MESSIQQRTARGVLTYSIERDQSITIKGASFEVPKNIKISPKSLLLIVLDNKMEEMTVKLQKMLDEALNILKEDNEIKIICGGRVYDKVSHIHIKTAFNFD